MKWENNDPSLDAGQRGLQGTDDSILWSSVAWLSSVDDSAVWQAWSAPTRGPYHGKTPPASDLPAGTARQLPCIKLVLSRGKSNPAACLLQWSEEMNLAHWIFYSSGCSKAATATQRKKADAMKCPRQKLSMETLTGRIDRLGYKLFWGLKLSAACQIWFLRQDETSATAAKMLRCLTTPGDHPHPWAPAGFPNVTSSPVTLCPQQICH